LVYEVRGDSLFLGFRNNTFLVPFDGLPALKLDKDLVAVHVFEKVEVNIPIDGVSCNVEGLVDLYEHCSHPLNLLSEYESITILVDLFKA
jgi:hypothetical protein